MSIRCPSLTHPALESDAIRLRQRLFRPLSYGEFFGLALASSVVLAFAWQHAHQVYPYHYDLGNYLKTANDDFSAYFYAYWFLPVFNLLSRWPFPIAFAFWNFLNIMGTFLASRVFGGKVLWTLISYQMIYTLFQGNIAGILAGALALAWICMVNRQWLWSGLFLLVAGTKYQIGIPFGLLLLSYAPGDWRQKARSLIFPVAITLASFAVWGFWPWKVLTTIHNTPPDTQGNITLWG
ncbi:MAG: glycosyltransferase family 87 protein, partial [Anaerolineales bacterium]